MDKTIALSAAIAAALLAASSADAAGLNRAWVSGHGTDAAGCGAPTAACRSLQYVLDHIIAAGGEIDVLDPGGYGAISISKSISIVNDGVGTAGVQATNGNAISIIAGVSDSITLRGLNIDGLGTGHDGISLSQAGALTVTNCVIRHFAHDGMDVQPDSHLMLTVVNSTAADNANNGYELSPSGAANLGAVIDHSYATNNVGSGINAIGVGTSGTLLVTVSNGVFSGNLANGITSRGSSANTRVNAKGNVTSFNNIAYYAQAGSQMILSQSFAFWSTTNDLLIDNGAQVFSFHDNELNNVNPATGTMTAVNPN
jgi:hypothetical protein